MSQYMFTDIIMLRCVEKAVTNDPAHCPNLCGRFYRGQHRKINLRRHVFECGVLPKFSCYVCTKRFFRRYQLKIHMNTVHKHIM